MPYHCYGHFYQMQGHNCRSTLEIVQDIPENPNTLLDPDHHRPDVVCVMMNPGTSSPLNANQNPGDLIENPNHIMCNAGNHMVATNPDPTQSPITRMMDDRDLCHVRVLNLFDKREQRSSVFLEEIYNLPPALSIFSPEREAERQARINPTTDIVVVAWGVNTKLRHNARCCVDFIEGLGLHIHGHHNELYYHPSRNPNNWLQYILDSWPN